MSQKIPVSALKAYLKQHSQEELIADIVDLCGKFKHVNDYYALKLNPAEGEGILRKYKKIVNDEFFPTRGFGKLRASVVKKAISDYRKVGGDPSGLAELMLFYVEMGTKFIHTYGDIDEVFYDSMEGTYEKALQLIFEHGLQAEFQDRCEYIVRVSQDTGYGFGDTIYELYRQYYFGE